MKKLDEIIKSPKGLAGFTLARVYEDELFYIYEKFNHNENYYAGFELFEKRVNTMYNTESVPGGEAFGVWAWQFNTLDQAKNKIKQLENERN